MNLDRLLNLITIVAWTLFTLFTLVAFVRTARRAGLPVAVHRTLSARLIVPLLLLIALSLLNAAVVFVPPEQIGVVISLLSPRGIRERPMPAGLHLKVPLAELVHFYPTYWQTYTMSRHAYEGDTPGDDSIIARTADGQEVIFDTSVIFRLDSSRAVRIYIDWQDRYLQDFVRPAIRGIIRTQVAAFAVDEVNSIHRQDLESALQTEIAAVFLEKGLILDRFILRNIAFSAEYAASVEQKQVALEGATRTLHEAEQIRHLAAGHADEVRAIAEADADAVVVKAQAEATAQVIRAEAEATALRLVKAALAGDEDLLTYRYIEKLSPGVRVMLVPSDNPFILPLPNLAAENVTNVTGEQTPTPSPAFAPTITNTAGLATPTPLLTPTATAVPETE
jgi:regulator of protease activity HflC (stomatin/prohibitin superfamily)